MKKTLFVLVLVALVTGGVFAQESMWTSYAPGVVDSGTRLFLNMGAAFGFFPLYTAMAIPPLEANIEYALPISLPLSIGGFFAYAQGRDKDEVNFSYAVADQVETAMTFGLRVSWHFNIGVKNLDTYASIGVGWLIWTLDYDWKKGSQSDMYLPSLWANTDYSQFFYDVRLGIRYYFTKNIGIYGEVGYNVISIAGVGLAFKF